eukprot:359121-Chlamydomonas_euryale.AAC.3
MGTANKRKVTQLEKCHHVERAYETKKVTQLEKCYHVVERTYETKASSQDACRQAMKCAQHDHR